MKNNYIPKYDYFVFLLGKLEPEINLNNENQNILKKKKNCKILFFSHTYTQDLKIKRNVI